MPIEQTLYVRNRSKQLLQYIQRFQGENPEPLETLNTVYVRQVLTYINYYLLNGPAGDKTTETYSTLCSIFVFIASNKPQNHDQLLFSNDLFIRALRNAHPVKACHLLLVLLHGHNERLHNPKTLIKTLAENYALNQKPNLTNMANVLRTLNTIIKDNLISGLSRDDICPLIIRALRLADIKPLTETWASLGEQLNKLLSTQPKKHKKPLLSLLGFIRPQPLEPEARQREHERSPTRQQPLSPLIHVAYMQNGLLGKRLQSHRFGVNLNRDDIDSDSSDDLDLERSSRSSRSSSLEPGEIPPKHATSRLRLADNESSPPSP